MHSTSQSCSLIPLLYLEAACIFFPPSLFFFLPPVSSAAADASHCRLHCRCCQDCSATLLSISLWWRRWPAAASGAIVTTTGLIEVTSCVLSALCVRCQPAASQNKLLCSSSSLVSPPQPASHSPPAPFPPWMKTCVCRAFLETVLASTALACWVTGCGHVVRGWDQGLGVGPGVGGRAGWGSDCRPFDVVRRFRPTAGR